jgi:hypothetical protein
MHKKKPGAETNPTHRESEGASYEGSEHENYGISDEKPPALDQVWRMIACSVVERCIEHMQVE